MKEGSGVYNIHSPRIPCVNEFEVVLSTMLEKLPIERLLVNLDCGLKT